MTELEWQKNAPKKPMNHYEAKKFADSLGEGWRLATIEELLVAYETKVGGFIAEFYWSSLTSVSNTNNAWGVDFALGSTGYSYKTDSNYVRCVRDA